MRSEAEILETAPLLRAFTDTELFKTNAPEWQRNIKVARDLAYPLLPADQLKRFVQLHFNEGKNAQIFNPNLGPKFNKAKKILVTDLMLMGAELDSPAEIGLVESGIWQAINNFELVNPAIMENLSGPPVVDPLANPLSHRLRRFSDMMAVGQALMAAGKAEQAKELAVFKRFIDTELKSPQ